MLQLRHFTVLALLSSVSLSLWNTDAFAGPKQVKIVSKTARIHAEPNVQSRLLYLAKQPDILIVAPLAKDGWYRVQVPGVPLYGYIDELEVVAIETAIPDPAPGSDQPLEKFSSSEDQGFQRDWGVLVSGGVQYLRPLNYTGDLAQGIRSLDERTQHLGYFIEPSVWIPKKLGLAVQLGWFGLEDGLTGYRARGTILSPMLAYQLVSTKKFALEFGAGSTVLLGANFSTDVLGVPFQESKGHYGIAGFQTRIVLRGASPGPFTGYLELGYKRVRRADATTQLGFKFDWDLSTIYAGLGVAFRL